MTPDETDSLLRRLLQDYRVSRGEKRLLQDLAADAQRRGQLAFLRHRVFAVAREELAGPQAQQVVDWLEDAVKALDTLPATDSTLAEAHFSPGDDCPRTIANLLRRTKTQADICVFTITDDRISDAIADLHDRKVSVRIITDNDKSADIGSDIDRLQRLGVPIRVDRTEHHMHHKYALFDNATLLTGSYNWTRSASEHNEENLILTSEPRLIEAFRENFERLWKSLG